jgi:hypothetical protein
MFVPGGSDRTNVRLCERDRLLHGPLLL